MELEWVTRYIFLALEVVFTAHQVILEPRQLNETVDDCLGSTGKKSNLHMCEVMYLFNITYKGRMTSGSNLIAEGRTPARCTADTTW